MNKRTLNQFGEAVQDLVRKAMRMEDDPREWLNCTSGEKQVARALELYRERGEYDGTEETAVECLIRACYLEVSDEA